MTASVLDRVRQIVADVFGLALDQVDAQSSPESIYVIHPKACRPAILLGNWG